MVSYIIRRLGYALIMVVLVSFVSFVIIELPPGDYLTQKVEQLRARGDRSAEQQVEVLRLRYGLDKPFLERYLNWAVNFLRGDFGESFEFERPVSEILSARLGYTVILALATTLVTWALAIPLGVYSAVRQYSIGDQIISAQLPSGAVFVPAATNPVLVRANYGGARLRGMEQLLEWRIGTAWQLRQSWTWIHAANADTGAPPDIEPGVPAPQGRLSLRYAPSRLRLYLEAYADAARRQTRLSTLALSDRRIGAARSRANIASFFTRGARVRGLTDGVVLLPTGETLDQVQQRVLGAASSAPMFTAIPGYAVFGFRAGAPLGERTDLFADFYNLGDRNYRGIGWGIDAPGRGFTLRLRHRF